MRSAVDSFSETRALHQRRLVPAYPNRGLALVRGEGVHLWDEAGGRYLDFMSGYGTALFGHGHPWIVERLSAQLGRLAVLHGSFAGDIRARAADALVRRCCGGLERVFFASSGAEAVEAALKFAAVVSGRKRFLACRGGFHGKTLGALSATAGAKYREAFEPLLWEFEFLPYGDAAALERALENPAAAFIVEPIQGESGVLIPPPGYLGRAAEACRARGALLIVDEIQTGLGRTGHFLASKDEVGDYDILLLGKGLGGGIPAGAAIVSEKVSASVPRGIHTSTFGGNPLVCAGMLAVLELLDEDRLAHVRRVGGHALAALRGLRSPMVREIRGRGLMLAVELAGRRDAALKGLQREGVLAVPAGENAVRFLPPLIINESHVDAAVAALDRALTAAVGAGACAGS
jgi:acetylornithine/LysW-gamma-L-lysine aminotransferase